MHDDQKITSPFVEVGVAVQINPFCLSYYRTRRLLENFAGWSLPILHYADGRSDLGNKEYPRVEPV